MNKIKTGIESLEKGNNLFDITILKELRFKDY